MDALFTIPLASIGVVLIGNMFLRRPVYPIIFYIVVIGLFIIPFFQEEKIKISEDNFIIGYIKPRREMFWNNMEVCAKDFSEFQSICREVDKLYQTSNV